MNHVDGDRDPHQPMAWKLGSTKNRKMIHRPLCAYGKRDYKWAGVCSAHELAARLATSGWLALDSNDACRKCAPDLADALADARQRFGVPQ